jgi:hypothetical protein
MPSFSCEMSLNHLMHTKKWNLLENHKRAGMKEGLLIDSTVSFRQTVPLN